MISKPLSFLSVTGLCLTLTLSVNGGETQPPGSQLASRVEGMLAAMKQPSDPID